MVVIMLVTLALITWTGLETYAAEGKGSLANISLEVSSAYADDHHGSWSGGRGGDEFWEEVHEFTVNLMLTLIFVHIIGVVISSLLHGENLPRAMLTGRKKIKEDERLS